METLQKKSKNLLQYLLVQMLVYRTHVDKIYTLAKLIDKVRNESLIFLCLGEPRNVELVGYLTQSLNQ